jgi:hypothetical protein
MWIHPYNLQIAVVASTPGSLTALPLLQQCLLILLVKLLLESKLTLVRCFTPEPVFVHLSHLSALLFPILLLFGARGW